MLQKIVTKHVDIRQQLQIWQNKTINILKKIIHNKNNRDVKLISRLFFTNGF